MKKSSLKALPLAAAMAAALMMGGAVQAQTNTTPPGSTKPQDGSISPAPATPGAARASTDSGASGTMGATTPGTTKSKDLPVDPKPMAAGSGSARTSAGASAGTTMAADPNKTDIGGTTKSKDNVSPAPTAGRNAKDADARTAAKADRKAKRDAKRSARKNRTNTASGDMTPQPVSGLGAVTPSPSK